MPGECEAALGNDLATLCSNAAWFHDREGRVGGAFVHPRLSTGALVRLRAHRGAGGIPAEWAATPPLPWGGLPDRPGCPDRVG